MSTGVSIDPSNWDAKRCAIQNDQNAQDDLNAFVSAFVRAVGDMVEAGEAVTVQAIKNRMKRTLEGKPQLSELTMNQWVLEFMDECERGVGFRHRG